MQLNVASQKGERNNVNGAVSIHVGDDRNIDRQHADVRAPARSVIRIDELLVAQRPGKSQLTRRTDVFVHAHPRVHLYKQVLFAVTVVVDKEHPVHDLWKGIDKLRCVAVVGCS